MPVRLKRVYDTPDAGDGRRVLVMRYWPRGVRKEAAGEWRRELGTSPELIRDWKSGAIKWPEFVRRYRKEMAAQSESIRDLAQHAKRGTVTLLCNDADDPHSHCAVLKDLIQAAGKGRKQGPGSRKRAAGT
jgi:uncharacterized protein YeaO (DUF488 family)